MSAIGGALQLNNDELALTIDAQQIDPPADALEVAEFFRDDVQVVIDQVYVVSQGSLEVCPLLDALIRKTRALQSHQRILGRDQVLLDACHVVQRHDTSLGSVQDTALELPIDFHYSCTG